MNLTRPLDPLLFPPTLRNRFADIGEAVIFGAGEIFHQKCRPSLEFLGISSFHIYDPSFEGINKIRTMSEVTVKKPVFVLSPNIFHYDQAILLANKSHIFFVEKPIVTNLKELDSLAQLVQNGGANGLYCADYYIQKILPLRRFLRIRPENPGVSDDFFQIDSHSLDDSFGKVKRIEGVLHEMGGFGRRTWLMKPGGGMLLDLMSHLTNILEFLGYKIECIKKCVLESRGKPLHSPTNVEEASYVWGECQNGIEFSLSAGKNFTDQVRYITFYDDKGKWVRIDFGKINTVVSSSGYSISLLAEPYLLSVYEFLDFYKSGGNGPYYWNEQSNTVQILEKIRNKYWQNVC